ncbi:Proline-rich protein 18 [Merluccius polli]|uniref:Proline-rich protein 18 n=1 Tax=Merluccius polli TaxID=89951 RepID=A0AA47MF34_MERPO|nr:Proline-rich protein 18 [Merluccius polli]
MPFPPINLHQRITSPGRDLFRKKKPAAVPSPQTAAAPTAAAVHRPGDEKRSDKDKFARSWPSANLRNLGRKSSSQQQKTKSPARNPEQEEDRAKCSWLPVSKSQDSCGVVTRSSSMESTTPAAPPPPPRRGGGSGRRSGSLGPGADAGGGGGEKKEIRFSLSLTPEAILVIQKRNLEKQMMAATRQQKCCVSADLRHRRVFPSKKAHGVGGSKSSHHHHHHPRAEDAEQDITAIVKISLLNDQYKYDDVEYEEEDADVDETVVRKCKEWLKGVESAAAFGKVDTLAALPHLKGCC